MTFRFWVLSAAAIWVFIKLPQEWWIHVAQLDTTDLMRAHPTATVLLAVVAAVLFAVAWRIVVPRLPDADHRWTFAAERVPSDVDPAALETYWARYGRVLSLPVLEKVALISLVCAVFAEMLPSVDATPVQVTFAVAVVVVADAAVSLWTARLGRRPLTAVGGFAAVAAVNAGLVLLDRLVLRPDRGPATGTTLFFVLLLALIVSLYDRYRPVYALRFAADATAAAAVKSPEPNRAVEGADPLRRRFHRAPGDPRDDRSAPGRPGQSGLSGPGHPRDDRSAPGTPRANRGGRGLRGGGRACVAAWLKGLARPAQRTLHANATGTAARRRGPPPRRRLSGGGTASG